MDISKVTSKVRFAVPWSSGNGHVSCVLSHPASSYLDSHLLAGTELDF